MMISSFLRWFLLLFVWQLHRESVNAQLGFVCEGFVEFQAELITQREKDNLDFYSQPRDIESLIECARACYIKEFCRSAVFDTHANKCEHSYFKGRCADDTVRERTFRGSGFVQLTCINCQRGYRVQDRPVAASISASRTFVAETPSQSATGLSRSGSSVRATFTSGGRLLSVSSTPRESSSPRVTSLNERTQLSNLVSRFGTRNDQDTDGSPPTQADFDKWSQTCFAGIRQNVILGGDFAVERRVTLLECQCLCAESWRSSRYDIKCRALMYYPRVSQCVLSQETKLNKSHPLVQVDDEYPVNYFDFTCSRTDRDIGNFISNVCQFVEAPPTTTTTAVPPSKVSDMCYVEVKEHLLRGSAAAIQSRVTLKECKCLCASSHEPGNSLGFQCMSVMYYYDEHFCILNSDNRVRRPDLFTEDVTNYAVTYYGFSCESSVASVNVYMTDHCTNVTDAAHDPHSLKN